MMHIQAGPNASRLIGYIEHKLYSKDAENFLKYEIPWWLAQLGMIEEPVPFKADIMERFKQVILKLVLGSIKDSEFTEVTIRHIINGLRKMGIRWHELNIIENSLNQTITEHKFSFPDIDSLIYDLQIDLEMKNGFTIESLNIIADFSSHMYPAINLSKLLNAHKVTILHEMFKCIQNEKISELLIEVIQGLRKMGIDWPELKVIENSVNTDLQLAKNLNEDDSTAFPTVYSLFKLATGKEIHGYFKPELDRCKSEILKYLSQLPKFYNKKQEFIEALIWYGIVWPELKDVVEPNKEEIIKHLLKIMKLNNKIHHLVSDDIDLFHKIGITWPELTIIENSIEVQRKENLRENDEEDLSTMYFKDANFIFNLVTDKNLSSRVESDLESHKNEIIQYFQNIPEDNWVGSVIIRYVQIITALIWFECNWPELKEVIKSHKKVIIKRILYMIKSGAWDYASILNKIKDLQLIDLNWPELRIMANSLKEKRKQLDEATGDNEKAVFLYKIRTLFNRVLNVKIVYPTKTPLEQYKSKIITYFQKMPADDWQHATLLISNIRTFAALCYFGCNWPELTVLIENHKSIIIKTLLIMITSDEWSNCEMQRELTFFDYANIKWPELDVIQKSISSQNIVNEGSEDIISLKYALSKGMYYKLSYMLKPKADPEIVKILDEFETEIQTYIQTNFYDGYYLNMFELMCTLLIVGVTWPWIEATLSVNKSTFIKKFLELVKEEQVRDVANFLEYAKKAKINWPELNIIERSNNLNIGHVK